MLLAAGYLTLINLATYLAFAADKRAAVRGERRVAERTLLLLAAAGGTPGAFAGRALLRHKTRKQPFGAAVWFIAISQVIAAVVAWTMLT